MSLSVSCRPSAWAALEGLREEQGHALEGHVLEGQGRPVPQLQEEERPLVREAVDLADHRHVLVVEVGPVGRPTDRLDLLRGHAQFEPFVDGDGPLPVRQIGQREDIGRSESRHPLGHEESPALRHPLEDDIAERQRLGEMRPGIGVLDHANYRGRLLRPCILAYASMGPK